MQKYAIYAINEYMVKPSDMSCRELLEELNPIIKEALERRPEVS